MKVFVIGIAGGIGRRLAKALIARGDEAIGPVRRPEQIDQLADHGVPSIQGDILTMSVAELAQAMHGSDAVVFTAGAGGKGGPAATSAIDGDGPRKLANAAALAGVRRYLLVSVFPEAWRERHMNDNFEHYMLQKKKAETELVRSGLDWVILRPSALTDDPGTGMVDLGLAQTHREIARDDVAATIVDLLHAPEVSRTILEVTGGSTVIATAIGAVTDPSHESR
ncbi:NAD-dependent dehydratase [Halomonas cupida]|uniref:NAD-dependent dehydratase n=1 Tax=Halomonas cupida TaxID=44933 RepID=A0A1M7L8J0_9GAMM|nr:NAD(P)-binding oxidoreductase [Halomonas cupida]GEN25160.1 NAD-dependent dehydratase [Halomonas cupida]SHM74133.1 Uncharacterized conserved protein YbjT, contains NAD(P)-binding and DUF2867 domains [Halomonas cupida]